MTTLLVNEIYPCLQGEGFNVGLPSVLVRLQICNLRCTWCDTPYTHTYTSDPSSEDSAKQKFKRMSLEDVANKISEVNVRNVIISGGEPTLQNFSQLPSLLPDHSFEVESNGTRVPHKDLPGFKEEDYKKFQWNISPKGAVAGESIINEAMAHWANLSKKQTNVFFKFVIRKIDVEKDLAEVLRTVSRFEIEPTRVLLMAEGTTQESQLENTWLHDICLKYNFRYTPRLHVLLFGPKRGV